MKLGLCNKCPVHFQLSIATGHLIGFHGNHFQNSKKAAISPSFGIYNFFLKKNFLKQLKIITNMNVQRKTTEFVT